MHKIKISPLLLLFVIVFAAASCSENRTYVLNETIASQFPLFYNSNKPFHSDRNLTVALQLRTKSSGDTLLLAVFIDNNSSDSLKINPGEIQIETASGIRADPFSYDLEKLTIAPESVDTLL